MWVLFPQMIKSKAAREDLLGMLGSHVDDSAEGLILPPIDTGGMMSNKKKAVSARSLGVTMST